MEAPQKSVAPPQKSAENLHDAVPIKSMNFESLVGHINQVQDVLQAQAAHAVNLSLTARNWLVGYYIVEFEQHGEDRAKSSSGVIPIWQTASAMGILVGYEGIEPATVHRLVY